MNIAENISKISWTAADKATFVIYGIASIVLLQITNSFELGIFTLFNNLHNLIFAIGNNLGFQSLLHFSSDDKQKPSINFYAMLNMIIAVGLLNLIIFIIKTPLSNIFNEPNLINIINSLPVLMVLSIPRYFNVMVCYRETRIWQLFISNLTYFGIMSGIIFYNVWNNTFLTYSDLINITYIGSIASVIVGTILNIKYWRFNLPNNTSIKYRTIINYSVKFSIGGIALTIPRTLDVYAIQYFFGTNIVGLYAPAKIIFRLVEDLMNAVYLTIYPPTIKYFANNDIMNINKLVSKTISMLFLLFIACTLGCFIFGNVIFTSFLPQTFINSIPIFNYLMLTSIILPITLLNATINAEGKTELVYKYILIGVLIWIIAFYFIGLFFQNMPEMVAAPYMIFALTISILFWNYAKKHYKLKLIQLFRIIPDLYNFIKLYKKNYKNVN
jgi:O-antigen/teichoic acid export membrane protein